MRCSIVCVISLLLCLAARAEPAAPTTADVQSLDDLLSRLSRIAGLSARYREEKHIALLKRPLSSEGRVDFARPNSLLRRVERPEPSTLLLVGDALRIADAAGTHAIDLKSNPIMRQFVLTFVYVLSGDQRALASQYALHFTHVEPASWRLVLIPSQPDLARLIAQATLEGQGTLVQRMTLVEANGDRTDMRFFDVDQTAHQDLAERARVFRLPER